MHSFSFSIAADDLTAWAWIAGSFLLASLWIGRKLLAEWRKSRLPPHEVVEKSHPVLGAYLDRETYWTASVASALGLGGRLEVSARGSDPTDKQLQTLGEIQGRLPHFLKTLGTIFALPHSDGRGLSLEGLCLADCKLVHLAGSEDGSFHARLRAGDHPEFDLTLSIETNAEGKLTYYGSQSATGYSVPGPPSSRDHAADPGWAEFRAKLPDFLRTLAPLVGAAENDGWGHSLPGFDLATAGISRACLRDDELFEVSLEDISGSEYLLGLTVLINRDWKVVEYIWSI